MAAEPMALGAVEPKPMLTVITACYNAVSTIEQTIQSVRDQRGVALEHILVDGGSKDGTMDIVARYRHLFSHVISEPDRGVYDAMQKGLMLAQGRYTGFLNADDYYVRDDVLTRLADQLANGQYLGISGVVVQVDEQNRAKRTIGRKPVPDQGLLWGRFPPHPATFLDTGLMRQAGGFKHDYIIAGDFDLFLRIKKLTYKPMAHVPWAITTMRLGGISTSSTGVYGLVGREMLRALRECGYPANKARIWLRGFAKLRELL